MRITVTSPKDEKNVGGRSKQDRTDDVCWSWRVMREADGQGRDEEKGLKSVSELEKIELAVYVNHMIIRYSPDSPLRSDVARGVWCQLWPGFWKSQFLRCTLFSFQSSVNKVVNCRMKHVDASIEAL